MRLKDKYKAWKLHYFLRKEQRAYKKEKQKCAKRYSDWYDDEFNMLDLKFIWALQPEHIKDKEEPSFISLNDAIVYYNRVDKKYYLYFDPTFYDCNDTASLQRLVIKLNKIEEEFAGFVYSDPKNNSISMETFEICDFFESGLSASSLVNLRIKIGCYFNAIRQWIEHL